MIKNYDLRGKIISEYHPNEDNIEFILADHIQTLVAYKYYYKK